jgi:hypothetical protein
MLRSNLALAAHLGDHNAALSLGVQAASSAKTDFAGWAWQLSDWGQEIMVRVALAAAKFALPIWENYQPTDDYDRKFLGGSQLRKMLDAIDAHLVAGHDAENELANAVAFAQILVDRAEHYVNDASGNAGVVERRKLAVTAAQAALAALKAAVWNAAEVECWGAQFGIDTAEVAARVEAGPALYTVDALIYARIATKATIDQLLAELRRVLL